MASLPLNIFMSDTSLCSLHVSIAVVSSHQSSGEYVYPSGAFLFILLSVDRNPEMFNLHGAARDLEYFQ